jgi:hypothetical protein
MIKKLQNSLDTITYPRQLNFQDIEQTISYLRKYFEEKGHNFREFDYADKL